VAVYPYRSGVDETDAVAGYDEIADGYARWWGPVIQPGAIRVLDLLAAEVAAAPGASVLDVGTGTGALAIAALERWPNLRVTGVDPSAAMLELAERFARERLPAVRADRFATEVGDAAALRHDDAVFDLAMSSFVLQLIDDRAAALREVRRVLRPGGTFAWVAWLQGGEPYAPDRIANEVLDDFGFDPPEADARPGDLASPSAAAAAMRRAGFRDVRARADEVVHHWDAEGYLAFFTEFDEASLFADLEPDERAEIEARILAELRRLTPAELALRMPVVYVTGRTPVG